MFDPESYDKQPFGYCRIGYHSAGFCLRDAVTIVYEPAGAKEGVPMCLKHASAYLCAKAKACRPPKPTRQKRAVKHVCSVCGQPSVTEPCEDCQAWAVIFLAA